MNEDINLENRVWSSEEIELSQKNILENYISTQLSAEEKERFYKLASSDSGKNLNLPKRNTIPSIAVQSFLSLMGLPLHKFEIFLRNLFQEATFDRFLWS